MGGGLIRGLQPSGRDADRGHSQSHRKKFYHVVERSHAPRRESKRDVGEGRGGGGGGGGRRVERQRWPHNEEASSSESVVSQIRSGRRRSGRRGWRQYLLTGSS
jgi:hypothetical protein